MIKILKEGKIKHNKTCDKCGCEFEFEAEDVTKRTAWDDHGGHYPVADFYEINCPWCNRTLSLSRKDFEKEEHKLKHI